MAAALALLGAVAQAQTRYEGLCDASAAVALDGWHFVVADDEHNRLTVYRRSEARSVGEVELDKFLKTNKEADLEGAERPLAENSRRRISQEYTNHLMS